MQKPEFSHIETISDSDSVRAAEIKNRPPGILPTEWPPPDSSNDDVATVRSISPVSIRSFRHVSPGKAGINHGADIGNAWKKLQTLRAHINALRGEMNRFKDNQKRILDKQQDADNFYLSLTRRKQWAGELVDEEIEDAFKQLEALRFEFSDAENEYTSLREPLEAAEREQMRMEYRFYRNLEKLSRLAPRTALNDINWSSRSATSVSSGEYERKHHPLWEDYQAALGEVNDLEEDLEELESFKRELEAQKELRRRVGKSLQSDDAEILTTYPTERAQLLEKLQTARLEAEKAKAICIDAGVDESSSEWESQSDDDDIAFFPSELSLSPKSFSIMGSEDTREQVSEVEEEDTSNCHQEPPKITEKHFEHMPRQSHPAVKSEIRPSSMFLPKPPITTTQNNTKITSNRFVDYIWHEKAATGDYVNLWLLHKLQTSPRIEYDLFLCAAESKGIQLDDSNWQANISRKWLVDGTSHIPSASITDPDSISTKTSPRHPFLYWKTKMDPYLPNSTEEAILASLLMEYFDPFIYSARVQPKGLLRSTMGPALQRLDFGNFLLGNRRYGKRKKGGNRGVGEFGDGKEMDDISVSDGSLIPQKQISGGSWMEVEEHTYKVSGGLQNVF